MVRKVGYVSLKDPLVKEKLINHPDYIVPKPKPKKPNNNNNLQEWRERCQSWDHDACASNSRLRKQIWLELNKPQEEKKKRGRPKKVVE